MFGWSRCWLGFREDEASKSPIVIDNVESKVLGNDFLEKWTWVLKIKWDLLPGVNGTESMAEGFLSETHRETLDSRLDLIPVGNQVDEWGLLEGLHEGLVLNDRVTESWDPFQVR
jgi:hypothetical protein